MRATWQLILLAIFCAPSIFSADARRPTISVLSPRNAMRVTNETLIARGTARDESGVAAVYLRLNGTIGEAVSTNAFTNWMANVSLAAGSNSLEVFAKDKVGIFSTTNRLTVTYVVKAPLVLEIAGPGKIIATPGGILTAARNQPLQEIGAVVRLTAAALPGARFVRWSGWTNATSAAISLKMARDLALKAEFVDIVKPTISIRAPANNGSVLATNAIVQGIARDNFGVGSVTVIVNNSNVYAATGTTNWNASVVLNAGANKIQSFATDAAGNRSATNTITAICLEGYLQRYWPMQVGDYKHFRHSKWGDGYLRVENETNGAFGGKIQFWLESGTAKFTFRNNATQLLLDHPLEIGPPRTFYSPFIFLDAATLAYGGAKASTGQALFTDAVTKWDTGRVPVEYTAYSSIKKIPGAVTVPAGVFTDCRQLDVTIVYAAWSGASEPLRVYGSYVLPNQASQLSNSYILAPGVGPIRIKLSWYGRAYLDWFDLVDGISNGKQFGNPPVAPLMPFERGFTLKIHFQDGSCLLSWPESNPDCVLESVADLGDANGWAEVKATPIRSDRGWMVKVVPKDTRFYRLRER